MPTMRMLVDLPFEPEGRAGIMLHPGDFFFVDDERAVEWMQKGWAQDKDAPYPPAVPPVILAPDGQPARREFLCES